jgi:phenylpropionate dioxygenase-like ring-hydroxylating dioxygenase large terminal subunit
VSARTAGAAATAFLDAARPFWHPVARTVDVDPGAVVPVTLLGRELVLWRSAGGGLGLADDLCSHRGTRLSMGSVAADGCITCPYHAWTFAPDGSCTRIPQQPDLPVPRKADVPGHAVAEQGGLVWACLDPVPATGPPRIPEADDGAWHVYAGQPMDWACQSTRQIENFLDIAHFSVVHTDAFGNADVMAVPPHDVVVGEVPGDVMTTTFEYPAVDMMAVPDAAGRRPVNPITFHYTVRPPFHVRIDSTMGEQPHILAVANQPVTATTCRVYWVAVSPAGGAIPDELVEVGEQLIFHADRRIVEGQRPERVPLDLAAELHLGFDRLAVAYRRAMAGLGFPVLGRAPLDAEPVVPV